MTSQRIAIVGHAGIGHVHGYGGLIQDDSAGFITVAALIREILGANTIIEEAVALPEANTIKITTMGNGTATFSPRRGTTPSEGKIIAGLVGRDALYCQALTVDVFGRIYGQGVLETPVSLQAALANSVVDTFMKKSPKNFKMTKESLQTNCGLIGGMITRLGNVDVSLLASVNYTKNGLGPAEDLEGNIALGSKRKLMSELDMLRCPTIVLESKAYLPSISNSLQQNTFLIRAQKNLDNKVVAEALYAAAKDLGYPVIFRDDLLPSDEGFMQKQTIRFANEIILLADKLKKAKLASEKTLIVAEMAKLVSQDAGGITCLSNRLHNIVRGPGMIPGTSAALSMLVPKNYYQHWKIPLFEEKDVEMTSDLIKHAVKRLATKIEDAYDIIDKYYIDLSSLERIIS